MKDENSRKYYRGYYALSKKSAEYESEEEEEEEEAEEDKDEEEEEEAGGGGEEEPQGRGSGRRRVAVRGPTVSLVFSAAKRPSNCSGISSSSQYYTDPVTTGSLSLQELEECSEDDLLPVWDDYSQVPYPAGGIAGHSQAPYPAGGIAGYSQAPYPAGGIAGYSQAPYSAGGPSGYSQVSYPADGPSGYSGHTVCPYTAGRASGYSHTALPYPGYSHTAPPYPAGCDLSGYGHTACPCTAAGLSGCACGLNRPLSTLAMEGGPGSGLVVKSWNSPVGMPPTPPPRGGRSGSMAVGRGLPPATRLLMEAGLAVPPASAAYGRPGTPTLASNGTNLTYSWQGVMQTQP